VASKVEVAPHFDSYCYRKVLEMKLGMDDCYDVMRVMLKMQELKEKLFERGVISFVPVGSSAIETLRKNHFLVDFMLNYSNGTGTEIGQKVAELLEEELLPMLGEDYAVAQSGEELAVYYKFEREKMNLRFFVQDSESKNIENSLKHWFMMRSARKDNLPFEVAQMLLKQWRQKQELSHLIFPEVLDSLLLISDKKEAIEKLVDVLTRLCCHSVYEALPLSKQAAKTFLYFSQVNPTIS